MPGTGDLTLLICVVVMILIGMRLNTIGDHIGRWLGDPPRATPTPDGSDANASS